VSPQGDAIVWTPQWALIERHGMRSFVSPQVLVIGNRSAWSVTSI
jgi:hypothetical protein